MGHYPSTVYYITRCESLPSCEGLGVGLDVESALTHPWPLQGGEFVPGPFSISREHKGLQLQFRPLATKWRHIVAQARAKRALGKVDIRKLSPSGAA